jgi:prefoldin subunit 5
MKEFKTLWEANYKKANFWISLVSIFLIVALVYAKLALKVDISAADIAILVSSVGALIVFIGNLVNNKIIVQTGESLDSTKITSATEGISTTVEQLEAEIKKLKSSANQVAAKVDATKTKVDEVKTTATAIADTVGATTTEKENTVVEPTITTSIGSVLDTNGNIAGTASVKATATK